MSPSNHARAHVSIHIDDADALDLTTLHVDHTSGPVEYVRFEVGPATVYLTRHAARGLMEKLGAYFAEREAAPVPPPSPLPSGAWA